MFNLQFIESLWKKPLQSRQSEHFCGVSLYATAYLQPSEEDFDRDNDELDRCRCETAAFPVFEVIRDLLQRDFARFDLDLRNRIAGGGHLLQRLFADLFHQSFPFEPMRESLERNTRRDLIILRQPAFRREVEDEIFDRYAHV